MPSLRVKTKKLVTCHQSQTIINLIGKQISSIVGVPLKHLQDKHHKCAVLYEPKKRLRVSLPLSLFLF